MTKLRAAGYCRTSGEGQRDNTSIPNQRDKIEALCKANGWALVHIYIDEAKSGAKIVGRDDFQQMMTDAANGDFDVIVPYDISRFARDGVDILSSAKFLKSDYGIFTVDTKGCFDNRHSRNTLTNIVHAGASEHERLSIMERMLGGRIRKAKEGKPWSASPPIGRAYDKESEKWFITDKGRAIAAILARYIEGESLRQLCKEFGNIPSQKISEYVHHGQLSGTYVARFNAPDIDLQEEVPVPSIPEVVPESLLEKARKRLIHNRKFNRHDVHREYRLSGFIRCEQCGKALTGQARGNTLYYRHNNRCQCDVRSVKAKDIEEPVLDYLYSFFLDAPAFNEAVRAALPSDDTRRRLELDAKRAAKQLAKKEEEISNLVAAIAAGAKPELLISQQDKLKAERDRLRDQSEMLNDRLANLPDPEEIARQSEAIRLSLLKEVARRNWWELSMDEINRFFIYLFGQSTIRTSTGIFVQGDEDDNVIVEFRGNMSFHHKLINGRICTRTISEMESVRPLTANK